MYQLGAMRPVVVSLRAHANFLGRFLFFVCGGSCGHHDGERAFCSTPRWHCVPLERVDYKAEIQTAGTQPPFRCLHNLVASAI